jgi:hypothetical protein
MQCCVAYTWPYLGDKPEKYRCPPPSVEARLKKAPAPKENPVTNTDSKSILSEAEDALGNIKNNIADGLRNVHVPKPAAEVLGFAGAAIAGVGAAAVFGRN